MLTVFVPIITIYMFKKSVVVTHIFNGNADEDVKFVEVEGQKFVDDGTGKPKVGDDGKPVPFVEKKQDVPPAIKVEEADLETLAKSNPHVAKLLDEKRQREADDAKSAEERKKAEEEDAKKKGEWQKLADERGAKLTEAEGKLKTKDEMLGKYVETTKAVLAKFLALVPKERQSLIPADFSERQKLEYVMTNLEALGVTSAFGKGGDIPKNDDAPNATEEGKIVARIDELTKKGGARTRAEDSEMFELAGKLKAIRQKKS